MKSTTKHQQNIPIKVPNPSTTWRGSEKCAMWPWAHIDWLMVITSAWRHEYGNGRPVLKERSDWHSSSSCGHVSVSVTSRVKRVSPRLTKARLCVQKLHTSVRWVRVNTCGDTNTEDRCWKEQGEWRSLSLRGSASRSTRHSEQDGWTVCKPGWEYMWVRVRRRDSIVWAHVRRKSDCVRETAHERSLSTCERKRASKTWMATIVWMRWSGSNELDVSNAGGAGEMFSGDGGGLRVWLICSSDAVCQRRPLHFLVGFEVDIVAAERLWAIDIVRTWPMPEQSKETTTFRCRCAREMVVVVVQTRRT
jgi:hypothetical protein